MTQYVVFERTQGSKCWTIAMKKLPGTRIPAYFHRKDLAKAFVRDVQSKRLGWWDGKPNQRPMESLIAAVKLPR